MNNLIQRISNYALPISIIGGSFFIAAAVLVSNLVLLAKLDVIEKKLPSSGEVSEKVDIKPLDNTPYVGHEDAPITMIEFADFQCPYCKQFQENTFSRFKEKYIDSGKVKFYFQNYPFLGEESFSAAEAAKCAQDQNVFWEFHDTLYKSQTGENIGDFTNDKLKVLASKLKLNTNDFNACLDSSKYKQAVQDEYAFGLNYGVDSTPTLFINGYRYSGALPLYKLDQAIQEVQAGQ